jgi:hypothetical protein
MKEKIYKKKVNNKVKGNGLFNRDLGALYFSEKKFQVFSNL